MPLADRGPPSLRELALRAGSEPDLEKSPCFWKAQGTCGQGPSTRPTTHRGLRGVLGQSSLALYVQGLGGGGQGQMGETLGRCRQ